MNVYDEFLHRPRLGIFSASVGDGWARPVPVWFEWADGEVRLFSAGNAPKVAQLRATSRAHLLVTNEVGEPERWVSLAGPTELGPVDGAWLETLTARYWNLSDETHAATLHTWVAHLDAMVGITLTPDDVHHYGF